MSEQAPPSDVGGLGALPQLPFVWPAGTLQARPLQQSEVAVQAPPLDEQALLPQRSTPVESARQGAPSQHSDENVHCWPPAMQHGAWPV